MGGTHLDPELGRKLILDELFDLELYKAFRKISHGKFHKTLSQLVIVEEGHFRFWQTFFDMRISKLDLERRVKLNLLVLVGRIFGERAIHLMMEAIEIFGVRKYLRVWSLYQHTELGEAVKKILDDELQHEEEIVSAAIERQINHERVRSIFLGFNDGLVEILGAVAGFFAAFQSTSAVLVAGITVSVAGAISMAAGAFVASSSEKEVQSVENGKAAYLGQPLAKGVDERPLSSAIIVGVSYVIGALFPVVPVALGATTILPSLIAGALIIVIVSYILAFLSGMDIKKRILMNLVIIAAAVGITYAIGLLAKNVFGISVI